MRIGLLHGWELRGSGSNEYTRYLARALVRLGHEVQLLCRDPAPDRIPFATAAYAWDSSGEPTTLFEERAVELPGRCIIHVLPLSEVHPVYVVGKRRPGRVKPFPELSDTELEDHRQLAVTAVRAVLEAHPVDVLHANHVILQPTIGLDAAEPLGIPVVMYPHGSAIEYSVKHDERLRRIAGDAIHRVARLVIGSHEVRDRILGLYPEMREEILAKTEIVGVGVDTSLFEPLPRQSRREAIDALAAMHPRGGKSPAQRADLCVRLDEGDIDAVRAYRGCYDDERPDDDVVHQLERVPWEDGRVLLFVGALTVGKGLQGLIVALPRILLDAPDAHLVIVGAGFYRETLEALVHAVATRNAALLDSLVMRGNDFDEVHLEGPWPDVLTYLSKSEHRELTLDAGARFAEHVHFFGRLDHQYLRHVFPCADVAIFPSIIPEAYPLVLMEALANGVVPVASDHSGFRDGLDALVPHLGPEKVDLMRLPMDPATRVRGIADRLAALLAASPVPPDQLRRIAETKYDWSVRAHQMVATYKKMLDLIRSIE